jgi:hypothetical protein
MSTLAERQNSPRALELLAAQRWTYSRAKLFRAVRVVASAGLAVAAPIAATWSPSISVYLAAAGGVVGLIAQLLGQPHEKKLMRRAAHVQDQFDSLIFDFAPRRDTDVVDEETAAAAKRCRGRDGLRDWYMTTAALPDQHMALLAQRSNLVWNMRQRKQYAVVVGVALGALLVVDVMVGWNMPTASWLVALFIPSLPGFTHGVEVIRDQLSAKGQEVCALVEVERLWDAAKSDLASPSPEALRGVQDLLLRLRAEHAPVPDWLHRHLRSDFQTNARSALDKRVTDFEQCERATQSTSSASGESTTVPDHSAALDHAPGASG